MKCICQETSDEAIAHIISGLKTYSCPTCQEIVSLLNDEIAFSGLTCDDAHAQALRADDYRITRAVTRYRLGGILPLYHRPL
jgi:hypothetical protein